MDVTPTEVGEVLGTLRTIKLSKNADGYWDNKDLVQQMEAAILLFDIMHPNAQQCLRLIIILQTTTHVLQMRWLAPDSTNPMKENASRYFVEDGSWKRYLSESRHAVYWFFWQKNSKRYTKNLNGMRIAGIWWNFCWLRPEAFNFTARLLITERMARRNSLNGSH